MEDSKNTKSLLGQKILDRIHEKKMKPSPRWVFLLKNYSAWGVGVFSLLVGSFASSVVFYMLINNDWNIYKNVNDSLLGFILVTLPYFWIFLLVILIILTDYNLKNTKKGYRYSVFTIFISTFSVSVFLGGLLYNFGIGRMIDDVFADKIPAYEVMFHKMNHRKKIWNNPERGLLIGIVSDSGSSSKQSFVIEDFGRNMWLISSGDAELIGKDLLEKGDGVRIVGKMNNGKSFEAFKIFYLPEKRWLIPPPPMMGPHKFLFGPPPVPR